MTSPTSDIVADFLTREADLRDMAPDDYDENVTAKMREAAALISSLVAENERLKVVVSQSAEATGAFISPKASIDFMEKLPGEIRLNREAAERLLAEAREALNRIADYPSSHAGACPEIAAEVLASIGGGNG